MMMQGYVNQNYEAMLSLVVRNGDKLKSITAVIDTGFTGFLSLPIATIRELELSWSYRDRATLGDGSEVLFDIYDGMVIWGGQYREIEINAAETEPLIGMSLLRGYRLQVDTVQGGLVTISELPIAV
ncbi:MAG: clan AA aspartic protease [Microcystis sp.]|jgi:clan AA aspartic protease|uniref:Clan AA aspartic protease n=2 Tax=Microcystis aeruginosa TaxID=1126 RepID=I4G8K6_MICAE|nr:MULTISPECIES: clan AA aspartic protease [Microcystis]MCA2542227.1 clan AA aspartic protease [Microcystis sp. M54BS1]MCA2593702.1 clan AA aspartic protease [Microcystis sp. M38BS1]MCA2610640.1 clan AA aspartic protease [Microcystis sp. M27BS1]MCZ8307123.1 clan AA aspartic protease [Microcystis sp. LE19-98.1E]NCS31444.1 clan AA aspartic protease [Microcystis aeruginosa F13-15]